MKQQVHPDGSITHYYEVGDLVELTKTHFCMSTPIYQPGDWGQVYRVNKPESCIAFLDIQMAGFSKPKNAFFQAATSVPCWNVKPKDPALPRSERTPMHASITVWPSSAEFRLSNGKDGSEPLKQNNHDDFFAMARIFNLLIKNKVETIEIRYENWDD